MRLFAAVVPPAAAVTELESLLRPLLDLPQGRALRWTESRNWHLTLAFFGEVTAEDLPELQQRLARAAHRHAVHRVRLAGAGRFGGQFGARTLWTGVRGDTVALRRLAESVQAAARQTGITIEDHPYRAHLTLARAGGVQRGGGNRAEPDIGRLTAALDGFEGQSWDVAELRLMRSFLGSGPPHHERLGAWPLADRRERGGPPGSTAGPAE